MNRGYVLAIFDTHGGHQLGLLAPGTQKITEGPNGEIKWVEIPLNAYQEYLWNDIYVPAIERVGKITKDYPLISLWGGDMMHGNRFPDQTITTSEYNQVLIVKHFCEPILNLPNCKTVRIAAGTGAHEFTEHSGPLLVAELLRGMYPNTDISANYQGEADVCGYKIDYAHHGPGEGIRIYLNGNNVRFYLSDLMIRCLSEKIEPPDLVLRGHVHGDQDESFHIGQFYGRILVIPSMCGMSFHGRKATKSRFLVPNGFVLLEVTDGKLTNLWKFYRKNDVRTKEKLL